MMISRSVFYILICLALIGGGGLYWTREIIDERARALIAHFKPQARAYSLSIARKIRSPVDSDVIPIAGVHATILAIFIGALSAYALYTYSLLSQTKERVFQEADQINSISVEGPVGIFREGINVASDPKNRQALVKRFVKLGMGLSPEDLPTDPAAMGQEALSVLSTLLIYYPFPPRVWLRTEERDFGPPQPISFTNIKEVRQWVSDIEAVVVPIMWVLDVHSSKLQEILEAFFEQQAREGSILAPDQTEYLLNRLTPGARADLLHMSDRTNGPRVIADIIFRQIKQAGGITQSVKSCLAQLDAVKKRHPMRAFMIGLLGAGFAFFCGVILPIFWRTVPALFVLWIPSIFYLITFTYAVHAMRKILKV